MEQWQKPEADYFYSTANVFRKTYMKRKKAKHILKTCYVSLSLLELGMYDVVPNFYLGCKASISIYEEINLTRDK